MSDMSMIPFYTQEQRKQFIKLNLNKMFYENVELCYCFQTDMLNILKPPPTDIKNTSMKTYRFIRGFIHSG